MTKRGTGGDIFDAVGGAGVVGGRRTRAGSPRPSDDRASRHYIVIIFGGGRQTAGIAPIKSSSGNDPIQVRAPRLCGVSDRIGP